MSATECTMRRRSRSYRSAKRIGAVREEAFASPFFSPPVSFTISMETNRTGGTGRRIFTTEEWLRINRNFSKAEKRGESDREKAKNQFSLFPRATLKTWDKPEEQSKKKKREILPELESTGRALTSDKTKEEIIKAAKKILFENKDFARRLLQGLRLSSVLHERNKQIDFNRRMRKMMEVAKTETKAKTTEEAKSEEEEEERARRRKMEWTRRELEKQIFRKTEERRREEEGKAREGVELAKMREEMKSIAEREKEEVEGRKEKLRKEIESYRNSEVEIRKRLKMKEVEQEEVDEIYRKVAREMEGRRRERERDRFARTVKCVAVDAAEPGKIRSEGDKKLESFLSMREARKKALLSDLLAGKKAAEAEAERRREEEMSERRKSSLLRRRKVEGDRMRSLREREERRKIQSNLRKWYAVQVSERRATEMEERERDKFYAPDFTGENQMIADYCDEVIRFVRGSGRPVFPVAAAVQEVKREFGIENAKNPNFLKSNVPINN